MIRTSPALSREALRARTTIRLDRDRRSRFLYQSVFPRITPRPGRRASSRKLGN
jgi:hypothetical protein